MRASIYARISFSTEGDQTSVENQLAACQEYAEQNGWQVEETFVDNSFSATSGAERPAFERLLKSNPEAIITWHIDRLVRVSADLERVVALGVNVYALRAGHIDLSTPAGRAVARTVVAWATYEGEHRQERQRLAYAAMANRGERMWGSRPFGNNWDGTLNVEEAEEVRRWANAILSGASLAEVTRQANARGSVGTRGRPWISHTVKKTLTRPSIAGRRTYHGKDVGPGNWEPVLDEETYNAVCRRLEQRSWTRRVAPRSLLGGVALCGECGKTLSGGSARPGALIYTCPKRHVARSRERVDRVVGERVCALLQRPEITQALSRYQNVDLGDSRATLASLRGRLEDVSAAYVQGSVSITQLTAITKALEQQIEEVEREMARSTKGSPLHLLLSAEDVQAKWGALETSVQREVITLLFDVVIDPAPGVGRRGGGEETIRTLPAGEGRLLGQPAPA